MGVMAGLTVAYAAGLALFRCVERAPTRRQVPVALKLTLASLLVFGVTKASRPSPAPERYGFLAAVVLVGLALVIEHVRAVRIERRRAAAPALAADVPAS